MTLMPAGTRFSRSLWIILLIGLLLRLAFALAQPSWPSFHLARGGDTGWYLVNGYGFFTGEAHGWAQKMPFYIERIPTPPLYILFAGIVQRFFNTFDTIVVMRLLQCLASSATVWLAARLALLASADPRIATTAAALAAFHPGLIVEPANIASETLYIFFLLAGLWLHLDYVVRPLPGCNKIGLKTAAALAALALALATLTRAVSILFPFVIVLHLFVLARRRRLENWRRLSLILIVVYAAMVSTWTIYNAVLWDRLVIASDQLLPTLWRGAEIDDGAPEQNDAILQPDQSKVMQADCQPDCKYQHPAELYIERIRSLLDADIGGLLSRRANELAFSLTQPHGTAAFGQTSIRDAVGEGLQPGLSLAAALALIQLEGFLPKLATWLFHIGGLALGLLGMWLYRSSFTLSLPLIGLVVYTVAAHFFLLALPRYLFPLEVIWLVFAGISLVALWDRLRQASAAPPIEGGLPA